MAPKNENTGERQPDPAINWIEFRDTLLASQTAMQNSIRELSQAVMQHIGAVNPRPAAAVAPVQQGILQVVDELPRQDHQINPMAIGQPQQFDLAPPRYQDQRHHDTRWESGF